MQGKGIEHLKKNPINFFFYELNVFINNMLLSGFGTYGYKSLGIDHLLINPKTSNYLETSLVLTSFSISLSIW